MEWNKVYVWWPSSTTPATVRFLIICSIASFVYRHRIGCKYITLLLALVTIFNELFSRAPSFVTEHRSKWNDSIHLTSALINKFRYSRRMLNNISKIKWRQKKSMAKCLSAELQALVIMANCIDLCYRHSLITRDSSKNLLIISMKWRTNSTNRTAPLPPPTLCASVWRKQIFIVANYLRATSINSVVVNVWFASRKRSAPAQNARTIRICCLWLIFR